MVSGYVYTNSAGGVNAAVERVGDGKRFQEWQLNRTARETSLELAKFFEVKNWARMTPERYSYLLGTDSWAQHFDPFTGTSDGRKIVIRGEWVDSYVVEVGEKNDRWRARATSFEECKQNTGWKLAMPLLFQEFKRNTSLQVMNSASYEEYLADWLSEGTRYLKEWADWIRCVRGRTEANSWLSIGALPIDAVKWIKSGWNASDAAKHIELLAAQEKLRIAQEKLKDRYWKWVAPDKTWRIYRFKDGKFEIHAQSGWQNSDRHERALHDPEFIDIDEQEANKLIE